MTFTVDRTSVTEGDVVEVRWDCNGADRVELTIDNGFKVSTMPVDVEGSKRFRLNRSKGHTDLTVRVWVDGKEDSKTLRVKVKPIPVTEAETVDDRGRHVSGFRQWWQTIMTRWQSSAGNRRLQSLPPTKRMAVRDAGLLLVVLAVSFIAPGLLRLLLIVLVAYLLWQALKK